MRAALLVLLTCCDAGRKPAPPEPPPVAPPSHGRRVVARSSVKADKLPTSGIAVLTTGMGNVYWDIVDYAAKTLVVTTDENGKHSEKTIQLDRGSFLELTQLAEKAWREVPHGDVPHAMDINQTLYIADRDDAFELHGEPIGDVTGRTGYPDASALVLAIEKIAADSPRHPHAVPRGDLALPDLDLAAKDLPTHGAIIKSWGIGGYETLVIDRDKSTLRQISNVMNKPHFDKMRELPAAKTAAVMTAMEAAWAETQVGEMPTATDVREDMYIFDDDEAFYLSGHPIGGDSKQGRPLAGAAMEMLFKLVR